MARAAKVLCLHCDKKMSAGGSFCEECGHPSVWASYDERTQWEVAQWRRAKPNAPARAQGHASSPLPPRRRAEMPRPTPPIERRFGPSVDNGKTEPRRKDVAAVAAPPREREREVAVRAEAPRPPARTRSLEQDPVLVVRTVTSDLAVTSDAAAQVPTGGSGNTDIWSSLVGAETARGRARSERAPKTGAAKPEDAPAAAPRSKSGAAAKKAAAKPEPAPAAAEAAPVERAPAKPVKAKPVKAESVKAGSVKAKPAASKPALKRVPAAKREATPASPGLDLLATTVELLQEINRRMGTIEERLGSLEHHSNGAASQPRRRFLRRRSIPR